jgi:iron complex outermembrane receptor protein
MRATINNDLFRGTASPARWLLLVLLVCAVAVTPAAAQDEADAAADAAQEESEEMAEDAMSDEEGEAEWEDDEKLAEDDTLSDVITVTARRREENIQEVPVAVSVVTGQALEDIRAKDISIIQDKVPNTSIYAGRNQSTTLTAFVRGVGQADPLWGVDPGVGLYIDDVYIARPQGALLDIFDVDRVEVLRGPQGTLYGKNTIGGAIKYVSTAPTDDLRANVSVTAGEHSTAELRATVSGALVPGKLRASASFASLNHDGYGRNLFQNRDVSDKATTAWRLGLDWFPSDDVSLRLTYYETRDDAEPKGLTRLEANPFCLLFLGAPCPPNDNLFDTQSGLEPTNGTDSLGLSAHLLWNISPSWQMKSITAYRESDSLNNIDFDTTPAPITDVFATYFDDQFSQEFQFLYTGDRLDGVLGLYYFDGFAGGLVQNNFLNALFGTTAGATKTDSIGIFGEGHYALTDRLKLNLGLRFTSEDKNGRAFNAGYADDSFEEITAVTADYDETTTFDSWSPKIGLDYQFTPDVMGYVSFTNGFKSGGYNVRAQSTFFPESALPFDDEKLTVGEVGIKTLLADRQLLLNAAVFYGDYSDIQVSTFTSFDSDGDGVDDAFFGNFVNAGDATNKGFELEFDWNPQVTWLGFNGFLAYLDAEPDSFLDENNDGFVDTQVITNAPQWTYALYANVNFPALGGLISGSLGYSYRDDSVLTNEGGPDPTNPTQPLLPIVQPAYGVWNSWIGWFSQDGTWKFTVNALNLADEEFLTNGYNIPVLGILQGSYGTPRTITATVGFNYN